MKGNKKNKQWFTAAAIVLMCIAISGAGAGTNWPEKAKLIASDGAAGDYFGGSVSISGNFAIVGASYDADKGANTGSAYIFIRDGNSWIQQAKLTASDGAAKDWFGWSVSISGDYAIVGATHGYGNVTDSGSAYIFKRDGTSWVEQQKLTASDGATDDWFGCSVSISGDYVIIGARKDDDNGTDSGSAYIFIRDGNNWMQQAKLTASDGAVGDWFGWSVSISGDFAIVGVYQDDLATGSAYIFKREDANWSEQQQIRASDGDASDRFGYSVSISSDFAIVGAPLDDDKGYNSGSAYIFVRDGNSWIQQQKLTGDDGAVGDDFGLSVSISGDFAIVGAIYDDDKGSNSGSAYIFIREGNSWIQKAKLVASDGTNGDEFGCSVSISEDFAVAGAQRDDDKGYSSGSAYIFMKCPAADLSGDCLVNFADLAVLCNQWLQSPGVPSADIAPLPDGDGIVDFLDLAAFAEWWLYGTD